MKDCGFIHFGDDCANDLIISEILGQKSTPFSRKGVSVRDAATLINNNFFEFLDIRHLFSESYRDILIGKGSKEGKADRIFHRLYSSISIRHEFALKNNFITNWEWVEEKFKIEAKNLKEALSKEKVVFLNTTRKKEIDKESCQRLFEYLNIQNVYFWFLGPNLESGKWDNVCAQKLDRDYVDWWKWGADIQGIKDSLYEGLKKCGKKNEIIV